MRRHLLRPKQNFGKGVPALRDNSAPKQGAERTKRGTTHAGLLKPSVLAMLASFAITLMPYHATAQIFTGAAQNPVVAMPNSADPVVPPVADVMRFLPSTPGGLRVTGEVGDLRWPVYLTAAQARATTRFRIAYSTGVSTLPDTSFIEASANGRVIGTDVMNSASGPKTIEFTIPADALQPGYNAISLAVQQRHRVDCSVAATYELWTRIDPAQTGLVMGADAVTVTDIHDIAALLPRPDGTLPIHILLSGKTNPTHLQRLIRATQEIALIGHFLQPAVDFNPAPNDRYGVTLALGTRDALARSPQLADLVGGAGPQLEMLPSSVPGRPILVVTGANDAEVDQALSILATLHDPHGTPLGLEAIAQYPALTASGADSLRLRDFGIRSQDFDGRFFRTTISLNLPADFLASDYGRGTLDLAGGYAAGLDRGAQARVDVNGRSAGTIKFPSPAGDVFQHNALFLPLSLMQPGFNRIDIMAETPRAEDTVCAQTDGHRFLLLDHSQLTLPVLAHVERLPDLAVTAAGGLPYLRGVAHLVVPKPDRETMSAALSLTARAALAAGRVVPFRFSTTVGAEDDGSTLIVSPARQLDPATMAAVGLDPASVEGAWHDLVAPSVQPNVSPRWWTARGDGPPACHMPVPISAQSEPLPASVPQVAPETDDLLVAWTRQDVTTPAWTTRIMTSLDHALAWAQRLPADLRSHVDAHVQGPTISSSLVLAQGMSPGSSENVTTIVTAPNAATLQAAMSCLFDPQVWPKIHGRLTMVDATSGEVTTTPATSFHYVSAGPSSLANSRLVVAGWFSLNPLAFAGMALLTALCLSGTTLWFVRNVGRRPE